MALVCSLGGRSRDWSKRSSLKVSALESGFSEGTWPSRMSGGMLMLGALACRTMPERRHARLLKSQSKGCLEWYYKKVLECALS